jgi:hypothetical protein
MVENGQSKIKTLSQQTRTRKATNTLKPQFQLKKRFSSTLLVSTNYYPGPRSQTIVFGWTDNTNKQTTIKQSNNPLETSIDFFLAVNSPTHAHTVSHTQNQNTPLLGEVNLEYMWLILWLY